MLDLLSGVAFGAMMGLKFGWSRALTAALLWIVLFGLFAILPLALIEALSRCRLPTGSAELRQRREITLPETLDAAFRTCVQAVREMPRCSRMTTSRTEGVIETTTRASLLSFGERIVVRVTPESDRTSRVEISSEPKMSFTIADWGTNWRNVERLQAALRRKP